MSTIYGYCRISTTKQSSERQVRNIKKEYPEAVIIKEAYTGRTTQRPRFTKLLKNVKEGDTIVFDSVSRMSRNSEDGVKIYFALYDTGVNLIFLKEPYINSSVFKEKSKDKIELLGTDEDEILKGINNYFRILAKRQIKIAFDQSEKEVEDMRQRIKEGIETARLDGKQIGQKAGIKFNIKKEQPAKDKIRELSKDFDGYNNDIQCIKIIGISRNTFYKYKRELRQSMKNDKTTNIKLNLCQAQ